MRIVKVFCSGFLEQRSFEIYSKLYRLPLLVKGQEADNYPKKFLGKDGKGILYLKCFQYIWSLHQWEVS